MAATVTATAFDSVPNIDSPFEQNVSIDVASGDTRAVLVVQQAGSGGPQAISSILFDGVAMTEITGSPFDGAEFGIRGFYVDVSAKSPGTYVGEIRYNGVVPDDGVICCYVLAGAGDPTNWTEDTGTSTTLVDIAVSGDTNGIVIWAINQDIDATLTPSGGETEVYDGQFTSPSSWAYASGYYKAGSGETTTSNIAMDSGNWSGVGFFVPSAGGGASNPALNLSLLGVG